MPDIVAALYSFIGTIVALAGTRAATKQLEQADVSRDLLLHLANALTSFEGFIGTLALEHTIADANSLRQIPSGFQCSGLPLPIDKALAPFTTADVHRLLLLYYNRFELFTRSSADHRAAYYWLLDAEDLDWESPRAMERLEVIGTARAQMREHVREMLHFGYGLIEVLFPLADSILANIVRGNSRAFLDKIRTDYRLTPETTKLRRAYYRLRYELPIDFRSFDPNEEYCLVRWDDATAEGSRGSNGRLRLTLARRDRTSTVVRLPPFEDVAILRNAAISRMEVGWSTGLGSYEWVGVDVDRSTRDLPSLVSSSIHVPPDLARSLRLRLNRALTQPSAATLEK